MGMDDKVVTKFGTGFVSGSSPQDGLLLVRLDGQTESVWLPETDCFLVN